MTICAKVITREKVEVCVDLQCEGGRGSAERMLFGWECVHAPTVDLEMLC